MSQQIQREGQRVRKVRNICEMKRCHGAGEGPSHRLNTGLPQEGDLKVVGRTGRAKVMRGDTCKCEELKEKRKNWF